MFLRVQIKLVFLETKYCSEKKRVRSAIETFELMKRYKLNKNLIKQNLQTLEL